MSRISRGRNTAQHSSAQHSAARDILPGRQTGRLPSWYRARLVQVTARHRSILFPCTPSPPRPAPAFCFWCCRRQYFSTYPTRPPSSGHLASKIPGHKVRTSLLGGQRNSAYQPLDRENSASPYPYVGGGYHDREGLTAAAAAPSRSTSLRNAMYMPSTRWTWAFMMTTLFQAAIALGLEGCVCLLSNRRLVPSPTSHLDRLLTLLTQLCLCPVPNQP